MSYSVDAPKTRTRSAWTPSRRSATWWQLHKTRGTYAQNVVVTPVDETSFTRWGQVIAPNIVEAGSHPVAIDTQLHDTATERRVRVSWTERILGVTVKRRALIELA